MTVAEIIVLAHSLTENKQLRFVLPAIALLLCAFACAADALLDRLRPRGKVTAAALVLAGIWLCSSGMRAATVTFAGLGVFEGQAEAVEAPWRFRSDLNRALAKLGRREDLCGLIVYPYGDHGGSARLSTMGGYTYLHRAVPMTAGPLSPATRPFSNYALACPDAGGHRADAALMSAGFAPLGRVGGCLALRDPRLRCDLVAAEQRMAEARW